MITAVLAENIKGLSFQQPLGRLTLVLGPNGSGKSARVQALQLAVMGFIPGGEKKNQEILAAYSSADKMVVGFQTEKYKFERGFVKGVGGSVAQGFKVNGSRASKEFFLQALGEGGVPKVVDLSAFFALSDPKKLDMIFSLFPPVEDPLKLQLEIDRTREGVNSLAARVKDSEGALARLASTRGEISLPAGTLADINGRIEENAKRVVELRGEIAKADAEAVRLQAIEDERKRVEAAAAEKRRLDEIEKAAKPQPALDFTKSEASKELDKKLDSMEANLKASGLLAGRIAAGEDPGSPDMREAARELGEKLEGNLKAIGALPPDFPRDLDSAAAVVGEIFECMSNAAVAAILGKILGTMERAGCSACAARLVIISEMKKIQRRG